MQKVTMEIDSTNPEQLQSQANEQTHSNATTSSILNVCSQINNAEIGSVEPECCMNAVSINNSINSPLDTEDSKFVDNVTSTDRGTTEVVKMDCSPANETQSIETGVKASTSHVENTSEDLNQGAGLESVKITNSNDGSVNVEVPAMDCSSTEVTYNNLQTKVAQSSNAEEPSSNTPTKSELVGKDFLCNTNPSEFEDTGQAGNFSVEKRPIEVQTVYPESFKQQNIQLYGEVTGPCLYNISQDTVTKPLLVENLPAAFEGLPVTGKPGSIGEKTAFLNNKLREFVGCNLPDEEFEWLTRYCSIDHMKTGKELAVTARAPSFGVCPTIGQDLLTPGQVKSPGNLCINKKYQMREDPEHDALQLKYRGVRVLPVPTDDPDCEDSSEELMEPGKELIFRIRIYRPYPTMYRQRQLVCQCDVLAPGRASLRELRDRFVCANDLDVRLDVADRPEQQPASTARELFPSGYFFIDNVFYVDSGAGCKDLSLVVRQWAARRGLGQFPRRDMAVTLRELAPRLGHPEVYVHQGNCEHIFTFSSVRLLNHSDPLLPSSYPYSSIVTTNQTVYCTTCAEFGAKWIVTGSDRVPFDPAFFCETCLRMYMYKDGQKIEDFKLYSHKANEINVLKPSV